MDDSSCSKPSACYLLRSSIMCIIHSNPSMSPYLILSFLFSLQEVYFYIMSFSSWALDSIWLFISRFFSYLEINCDISVLFISVIIDWLILIVFLSKRSVISFLLLSISLSNLEICFWRNATKSESNLRSLVNTTRL